MIVLHRKTLAGAEVASLPDLSMQFVRRASHYLGENRLTFTYLTPPNYAESQVVSGGIGIARFLANI